MKALIIVPNAGFGNRIRAVASAILLAKKLGRVPYICWPSISPYDLRTNVAEMQILGWEGLFETIIPLANKHKFPSIDRVYSEWMPGDGWYPVQNYTEREWSIVPNQRISSDGEILREDTSSIILIETSLAVQLKEENWEQQILEIYQRYFIPKQKYLDQLVCEKYDLGISIRKGDLGLYFPEANQSDHDLERWILELSKTKKLIIFSDDHECQRKFRELIGIPNNHISPILQFLTLALRCKRVSGTPESSFAEQAALFGGIPYSANLN